MKNPIFDIENWREIGARSPATTRTFLTAFGFSGALLAMLRGGAGGLKGLLMRNLNGFRHQYGRDILPYHITKGFNKGYEMGHDQSDLANIRRLQRDQSIVVVLQRRHRGLQEPSEVVERTGVESDYFKIMTPVI